MEKIDIEAHFYTREYIKTLCKNKGFPRYVVNEKAGTYSLHYAPDFSGPPMGHAVFERLFDVDKLRLKDMDKAGINKQILSLSMPGVEQLEPSVAIRLARGTNDFLSKIIQKHPERFGGFAALAPQNPQEASDELERAVKELGLSGWNAHAHFGDTYIDNKKYWPILEKAEKLNVPIYLHPTIPAIPQLRDYGLALAGASFGFGVEAALCVMRLILSGAFDKYPKLRVILGHLGEALPFLFQRIDHFHVRPWLSNETNPRIAKKPSEYIRDNVYVTTSGNYHRPAFMCAYDTLGVDKILFATDYPYEDMIECIKFLEKLPLTYEDKQKIYFQNARKINLN
ncbi:MAG: amidohydrolase family protein [Candidatus Bathyarchaeia archaeon]